MGQERKMFLLRQVGNKEQKKLFRLGKAREGKKGGEHTVNAKETAEPRVTHDTH